MRILITGFPPFPGRPINPSQELIETLRAGILPTEGIALAAELLPCEYAGVEEAFTRLMAEFAPHLVLAFGVGRQATHLQLESRGVNRDHAEIPDNAGMLRSGIPIAPDGPDELHSPLPLHDLAAALQQSGQDARFSQDAGTYVCNHLVYFAHLHPAVQSGQTRFVFTHLPPAEQGLNLEKLLGALQIMIDWFQNRAQDEGLASRVQATESSSSSSLDHRP